MSHETECEKIGTPTRRILRSRNCIAASVTCVALSSLAMFVVFWCTNIFRDSILSGLAIRNGSSTFDWWQRPPVRPVYRIRIFNYTNIDEFERGEATKLKIVESGPYIYRETLTRVNPEIHENGTISYQEKRSFQWEGGSPDDEILNVPNVPLFSAVAFTRDMNFVTQIGLTAILTTIQAKTFVPLPAGPFLWGYDDKIFEMAKPLMSWRQNVPIEKFGILALKNGLSEDRIMINTGIDDINELGLMQRLNGHEFRDVWGDEKCDRIDGTDGSVFPPLLVEKPHSTLTIYAKDMCRSLKLEYQGHGTVHGIPTLTYKPPTDALTSSATKDNCYCSKQFPESENSVRQCPPAGIFNASVCNFNMPIVTSYPHFYAGDEKLLDAFEGLDPKADLHESVVEIHPRLGVPIGGHSRLQINVEARRAIGVPFLGKIKDGTILPILWVEVAIDKMPDSLINLLQQAYFTAGAVETGMQWGSLVGILFVVCWTICLLKRNHTERHVALKRNASGQDRLLE